MMAPDNVGVTPGWSVRYGTVADSLALATVHVASWRSTYADDLPAPYLARLDPRQRAAGWRRWFTETPMRVFIVEEGSAIVGFCAFGPCRDGDLDPSRVLTIYNLHAAPGHTGRGIGRLLFERVRAEAVERKGKELSHWVLPTNRRARQVYERWGFRTDGRAQSEELEPGALFMNEIRYRLALGANPITE
jgi:ribosomal protein S18 acetylase RimI-like enzyme